MYHIPGNPYSYGPVRADSLAAAKEWIKHYWNWKRLPKGVEVYESDGKV